MCAAASVISEIAAQVRLLARSTDLLDKPFNIVLMGMGEPLHNYDAVMKALRMKSTSAGMWFVNAAESAAQRDA